MTKLKQSISVQRQIPEHVRDNYPMFVEFVKMYYEYLEQTQQQNLEKIRDIDTVLDEFIDRFKSELSKNFPINLASDKKMVMKHLREFYLSRGSEASFKFLFRVLFGKEAELFYPSTQMLRVSDGRWQQDVSVFVQPSDVDGNVIVPDPSLDPFAKIGTYGYIKGADGKTIRTVIKNIVKYNEEIYELFIERDYINEIEVGSVVSSDDGQLHGVIVPCPTSVKIYKPGKGFKPGEIFSLKTQLGNGCVIKVTKTDTDGGIKKIQVIRFGLDYKSTFYSYLSNKAQTSYEYIHPLKIGAGTTDSKMYDITTAGTKTLNVSYIVEAGVGLVLVEVIRGGNLVQPTPTYTATNGTSVTIQNLQAGDKVYLTGILTKGVAPTPPAAGSRYVDPTPGFEEYGWASKQTYFYYDKDIPVGSEDHASDRYFAEPSYVGEIVQQFYQDTTDRTVDDDIAIIQVDMGAVAKYPGYYSTADSFISDEMYIQDGKYYQSFSYVIKVEEELRKYANIVRTLVHPAGMKLFSEYSIFNELKLSTVQPKVFLSLQLPVEGQAPSNIFAFDGGYSYSDYTASIVNGELVVEPTQDAQKVFSQQGVAAYQAVKNLLDAINSVQDGISRKFVEKAVEELVAQSDAVAKLVEKNIAEATNALADSINTKFFEKNVGDSTSQSDVIVKSVQKAIDELVIATEAASKQYFKVVGDVTDTLVDVQAKLVDKNVAETVTATENRIQTVDKAVSEFVTNVETVAKEVAKAIAEATNALLDDQTKFFEKNILVDSVTAPDVQNKLVEKVVAELVTGDDAPSKEVARILIDATNALLDDQIKFFEKSLSDSTPALADAAAKLFEKNVVDSILTDETRAHFIEKTIDDLIINLDDLSKSFGRALADVTNTLLDDQSKLFDKSLSDSTPALADAVAKLFEKNPYDTILTDETRAHFIEKAMAELVMSSEDAAKSMTRGFDDATPALVDVLAPTTEKFFSDSNITFSDSYSRGFEKGFLDIFGTSDDFVKYFEKLLEDSFLLDDIAGKASERYLSSATNSFTDYIEIIRTTLLEEFFSISDSSSSSYSKAANETITVTEDRTAALERIITEMLMSTDLVSNEMQRTASDAINTPSDYVEKLINLIRDEPIAISEYYNFANFKSLADELFVLENKALETFRTLSDSFSNTDAVSNGSEKTFSDTFSNTDGITNNILEKVLSETPTLNDSYNIATSIVKDDLQTIVEEYSVAFSRTFTEILYWVESLSKNIDKPLEESINITMDGALRLNAYDEEQYFSNLSYADFYQPATTLS